LASAVTLTKGLRYDIQALGIRLEKAAAAEELSTRNKTKAKSQTTHEFEIRQILQDMKKLLERIEDAVPLINLAITTSGANLSGSLPASVSPSRLLQASTFLTAGDTQYSISPQGPVQVGPCFTLSLYMLFAGHTHRDNSDADIMRDTIWKEVIHKARVKLVRVPLNWDPISSANGSKTDGNQSVLSSSQYGPTEPLISGEGSASEFAYGLEIVEDLDDDRYHSEEDESQLGPYGDVRRAGIREFLPIHQVSKIFYADTGKILNIGTQGEMNNPVLLLKRDMNALSPRKMMQDRETSDEWQAPPEEADEDESEDDSQDGIDQQIRWESSVHLAEENVQSDQRETKHAWKLPPGLDREWLAFEVYTESEEESASEDGQHVGDSAHTTSRPCSSREGEGDSSLAAGIAGLNLNAKSSPPPYQQVASTTPSEIPIFSPRSSPFGPIRSSLSLLEMLIRLTALQQFQQASHLSIPDEFLTFFLEESSTTGAGGDSDERRRTRRDARRKLGFDPYDESPVKRHGEEYQYQHQEHGQGYERGPKPHEYDQGDESGYDVVGSPGWMREMSVTPQRSPEPWLLRSRDGSSFSRESPTHSSPIQSHFHSARRQTRPVDGGMQEGSVARNEIPSVRSTEASSTRRNSPGRPSPIQPYHHHPPRRPTRPLDRVMQQGSVVKNVSPLGRGTSVETDSTLGTSPGSPTLVSKMDKVDAGSER
jgi:hypothetical protein